MSESAAQSKQDFSQRIRALLLACVRRGASDLHLTPGLPPYLRIEGELTALPEATLTASETRQLGEAVIAMQGPTARPLDEAIVAKGAIDGAVSASDGTRFRFNIFLRQNQVALVLRRLEDKFKPLSELGLPESLYRLCELRDGLVIISGATGSGKSTTIATLIDRINASRASHIITIEDPVEYIHKPIKSVINQRQIGIDAPSFNDALVSALRQDPDVVLVGEIRDLDTIRTAISAAETGHLVFASLHAGDCAGSIERLVSVFPANEQDGIRRQLALTLRAIVSQHLLPSSLAEQENSEKSDGVPAVEGAVLVSSSAARPRRVVASEVLFVTPAIANLIASAKSSQVYSSMETGQSAGMQTLEADLAKLWVRGAISEAVAVATARNPGQLRDRVALLRSRLNQTTAYGGVR